MQVAISNKYTATASLIALLAACSTADRSAEQWTPLFNAKDLSGWDTYLGSSYNPDSGRFAGEPAGLNNDPYNIYSVVEVDDQPAIRISGLVWGGISTIDEYSNYHLQLEFKWGHDRHAPRDSAKRDSGLLYHAVGPHAADGNFWMRSQEFQIQEGDCGDYWGVAGAIMDATARPYDDDEYIYEPAGERMTFGGGESALKRHLFKAGDAEKPTGKWNKIDLYCLGDTSIHVVNDVAMMVLTGLRQEDGQTTKPLMKGKIQIQSEGAEVFYRNIRIRSITSLPAEHGPE